MQYRIICDLPPELLHIIISELMNSGDHLRSCSLVCKCLRVVAVEYFFQNLRIPLQPCKPVDHLLKFLRQNERAARTVKTLTLSGPFAYGIPVVTIDDAVVANIVQLLPSLRQLVLHGLRYSIPPSSKTKETPGPFPLRCLAFTGGTHRQSSLSGLIRIISLFALGTLHISGDNMLFDTSRRFDPQSLHRPLVVSKLSTLGSTMCMPRYTCLMLEALSRAIAPDSLKDVLLQCDSPKVVLAIGGLLAHAGGSIIHLDILPNAPIYAPSRTQWMNPLEDHWSKLKIIACPQLESLKIYIHLCHSELVKPLSAIGIGMLSQAGPTLRFITIEVHEVPRYVQVTDRRMLDLQAFDRFINVTRFPALQEVTLYVDNDGPELATTMEAVFPELSSAGMLVVREL